MQIPDHPDIRNCERTGYPHPEKTVWPICPVCGEECDTVYRNKNLEIVGCEGCIFWADAWEAEECFPERNEE